MERGRESVRNGWRYGDPCFEVYLIPYSRSGEDSSALSCSLSELNLKSGLIVIRSPEINALLQWRQSSITFLCEPFDRVACRISASASRLKTDIFIFMKKIDKNWIYQYFILQICDEGELTYPQRTCEMSAVNARRRIISSTGWIDAVSSFYRLHQESHLNGGCIKLLESSFPSLFFPLPSYISTLRIHEQKINISKIEMCLINLHSVNIHSESWNEMRNLAESEPPCANQSIIDMIDQSSGCKLHH